MDFKNLLNRYYAHLKKEGMLKSMLCALIVGFSALTVSALACWLTGFKAVWIVAIVSVAAAGISFPVFQFVVFRFSPEKAAKRADAFGLEERIITMTELAEDSSYIAERQRQDAMQSFSSVSEQLTKLSIPLVLFLLVGVTAVLGGTFTTVAGLAATEVVPPISTVIGGGEDPNLPGGENNPQYEIEFVPSSYSNGMLYLEDGGFIDGDIFQIVSKDEEPTTVFAEAELDYGFAGWFDSLDWLGRWFEGEFIPNIFATEEEYYEALVSKSAEFTPDMETITEDTTYYALFLVVGSGGDPNGDPSDEPNNAPSIPEPPQDNNDPNSPSDGGNNGSEDSSYDGNNQIIDGSTNYGGELTGTEGDGNSGNPVGDYFDIIGG